MTCENKDLHNLSERELKSYFGYHNAVTEELAGDFDVMPEGIAFICGMHLQRIDLVLTELETRYGIEDDAEQEHIEIQRIIYKESNE